VLGKNRVHYQGFGFLQKPFIDLLAWGPPKADIQ